MQHNKQELCICTVHAEINHWMYINIPLNTLQEKIVHIYCRFLIKREELISAKNREK